MGCLQFQGLCTSTYLQEHVESRDALTVCEPECHTLETSRISHRTRLSPLRNLRSYQMLASHRESSDAMPELTVASISSCGQEGPGIDQGSPVKS
jgi:hypothetical protein